LNDNSSNSLTRKYRNELVALGFLAPNLGGFLLFVLFPILFSFFLVFTNWSLKPAIDTHFIGLDNVWRLVGFRPIEGAEISGGAGIFIAFIGSYIALAVGLIWTLASINRGQQGIKLGAAIYLLTGVALIATAAAQTITIGWGLFGIMLIFASLFMFMTDGDAAPGRALVGPLIVLLSIPAIRLSHDAFFSRWEMLDANFYKYLYNTLYLMVVMPFQIIGSLLLALALSRPLVKTSIKGRIILTTAFALVALTGLVLLWDTDRKDAGVLWATFWGIAAMGTSWGMVSFRTLFFLPSFTAGVAIMLLWKQVFNPNFGPLNESLRMLFDTVGLAVEPPRWLLDPAWAKPALMLMGFWAVVGGANMLLYVAGIANIPGDMYEAAEIDGASRWQAFRHVTWPQLAPTTFFITIMTTIAGIQGGFEQARVMTQGGPAGTTKTLSYYIYERAFEELELGYASAVAWVLFIIIFALTLMNWKFGNRYVND
jgi:multiple sugar transport system permease protein